MKKLAITTILALAFMTNTVMAQPQEAKQPCKGPCEINKMTPEMKAKMEKRMEEFNKSLGLTDAQIAQAKEIRKKGHEQMKPLIEKKRAKFEEIKKVMNDEDMKVKDQDKKVEQLKNDIKSIDQDIRQLRKDNEKAFKSILTEEQKVKYAQIKEEGKKHFKEHKCPQDLGQFGNRPPMPPKKPMKRVMY